MSDRSVDRKEILARVPAPRPKRVKRTYSLPQDVCDAFEAACQGKPYSQVIEELMRAFAAPDKKKP